MKFRSSWKVGHVGSKTRSLGQILGKPCVDSRGHRFESKFNFFRMLIPIKSRSGSKLGHGGSKTRSLGQVFKKPCVHSRGHTFVC